MCFARLVCALRILILLRTAHMSDQSSQEPTMEEILASIRRIISEDDAPAAEAEPEAEPVEEPAPAAAAAQAEPEPEAEEEVLDLVDPIPSSSPPPPAETHGDLDVFTAPPAAVEPEPEPVFTPAPAPKLAPSFAAASERLISDNAAGAAASAFGSLSAAIAMPKEGRSLEDVTRELLRPLIKSWLDENLPRIVEAKVEEEVQRIARQRG
jgi:cell pole-organizing protein PopZ